MYKIENFLEIFLRISSTTFETSLQSIVQCLINNFLKILISRIHYSPAEESPDAVHVEAFVHISHGSPPVDVNMFQDDKHVIIFATDFALNHDLDDVEWIENG